MRRVLTAIVATFWLVGCGGATDISFDDGEPGPEAGAAGALVAGRGAAGGSSGSGGTPRGGSGNSAGSGVGGTKNVGGSAHAGSASWAGSGGGQNNGGAGNAAGWHWGGSTNRAGTGGSSGESAGAGGSGGAGYDPACPPVAVIRTPSATFPGTCTEGTSCDYDPFTYCLCSSQSSIFCQVVDPTCPRGGPLPRPADFAPPEQGAAPDPFAPSPPAEISLPAPPLWHCECSMGRWLCG